MNGDDLKFYEDEQRIGLYHLEYYFKKTSSPIEAKLIVSPNIWEPQTKRCELKVAYSCLGYKYHSRKEVFDFANAISSRISWEHEIVWFTEKGKKTIWKNRVTNFHSSSKNRKKPKK